MEDLRQLPQVGRRPTERRGYLLELLDRLGEAAEVEVQLFARSADVNLGPELGAGRRRATAGHQLEQVAHHPRPRLEGAQDGDQYSRRIPPGSFDLYPQIAAPSQFQAAAHLVDDV
ncbi:MAG TPA: hypothetical protein VLC07_00365, partial [Solirubrobacterales bacterium]|nr:hypothetical protein [Solirubrobacterales bacterium]